MKRVVGRVVGGLAVTQTVGYGVLYYAFSVLLLPVAEELEVTPAEVALALTISVLVWSAVAIPIGRWLDRHGGRALMTVGSALGVVGVLAWSRVESLWQLYAAFVLIGLGGAASLYEAAFPVVIAATRPERRDRSILAITIVAGFASTIFFPLTGALLERIGWRATLLVLAGVLALVTIPTHAALVPRGSGPGPGHPAGRSADVRAALTDPAFWRLAAAFVASAAANASVGVLLVGYLRQVGHTTAAAATVAGLLGVLSVTGRVLSTGLATRFGMTTVVAAVFAVQAAGVLVLPHVGASVVGAVVCVTAFGLGFGVANIAKPSIIADRYGTARYATIASTMSPPTTLAFAFAPTVAAGVPATPFLTTAGLFCLASAVLLATIRTRPAPGPPVEVVPGP